MKFSLLDRILEFESGQRIVAVKAVTLSEEYLGDHFPTFPVLPGVMMLQALAEAGSWLAREGLEFKPAVCLLQEARNVIYKSFVKPGNLMRLEVTCRTLTEETSEFAGVGFREDVEVVRARFSLKHLRLAEENAARADVETQLRADARALFARLRGQDAA
jgi:3-hydroxyacyl-[acyl-carrier-protein] dehydratase